VAEHGRHRRGAVALQRVPGAVPAASRRNSGGRGLAGALVEALESGRPGGYAGDVWYPEPAPADHPWRSMPHQMLTPHVSGTTLDAQRRYAADTRHCLEAYLAGQSLESDHVIVSDGEIIGGAYKAAFGG
jgi:formate dehydrogenase